jgi:predicted nucleic acid-binding protein
MPDKVRAFLDTSALFAGIWSASGGARMILKLGEAGAIQLLISPQVLTEVRGALRRKAPDLFDLLTLLLNRSQVEVVSLPSPDVERESLALTHHAGDAQVLAAAWQTGTDYFITLDREHFLDNTLLRDALPFPVGTPGDFLAWYRESLQAVR